MFLPLLLIISLGEPCSISYDTWPDQTILPFIPCITSSQAGQCLVADAGGPFSSPSGTVAQLDGAGTTVPHSPGAVVYQWEQVDNGAALVTLENANTATPSFTTSIQGSYQFRLTASWYCRQDTDTVLVTITDSLTPSELTAEQVAFLSGCAPVQVLQPPGDNTRLFVVCRLGTIRIIKNGVLLTTPFLNVASRLSNSSNEQGLLGMAFHPDYASNGLFYINYTGTTPAGTGSNRDTRIVGYGTSAGNPDLADTSTAALLLSVTQPETNHNGGQLLFGPDGYLYIGMGDGGGGGDNHGSIGNGQNLATLLGKLLRIQVNGLNAYSVPNDNPFVGTGGVLPEIWAYGLRNPWRWSFDRQTGDIWIADVGQNAWEEVDYQPASSTGGENYGWRLKEGDHCFNPSSGCETGGLVDPIWEINHNDGWFAIIGGYVYRGSEMPALGGLYVFTDYVAANSSGDFRTLSNVNGTWTDKSLAIYVSNTLFSSDVTAFGEDNEGELYFCSSGGSIFKITGIRAFHP